MQSRVHFCLSPGIFYGSRRERCSFGRNNGIRGNLLFYRELRNVLFLRGLVCVLLVARILGLCKLFLLFDFMLRKILVSSFFSFFIQPVPNFLSSCDSGM